VGYSASEFTSISIEMNEENRRFIVDEALIDKQRFLIGLTSNNRTALLNRGATLGDNDQVDLADPKNREIVRGFMEEKRETLDKVREANASTWYKPQWARAAFTNGASLQAERSAISEITMIES